MQIRDLYTLTADAFESGQLHRLTGSYGNPTDNCMCLAGGLAFVLGGPGQDMTTFSKNIVRVERPDVSGPILVHAQGGRVFTWIASFNDSSGDDQVVSALRAAAATVYDLDVPPAI